jgi:hypothetical protein
MVRINDEDAHLLASVAYVAGTRLAATAERASTPVGAADLRETATRYKAAASRVWERLGVTAPAINALIAAVEADGGRAFCPHCGQPIGSHWQLDMSREELDAWDANELVCARSRTDVRDLLRRRALDLVRPSH